MWQNGFEMSPRVLLAAALPIVVLVALVGPTAGSGTPSTTVAARVIDRTYLCTSGGRDGIREIEVSATSGFRESGKWKTLASAGISNQGSNPTVLPPSEAGLRATVYTHWGFGFSAGAGALAPRDPAAPPVRRGFSIWSKVSKACAPASSRRVPLSPGGLSGGVASQLSDEYECPAPRRVYLRISGVFRSPASLRLDRRFLYHRTEVPLQEAALAVRSESGKPLAYVAVSESGRGRIFTAPSCVAD